MAETTDQGIPRWLTTRNPETLARDETAFRGSRIRGAAYAFPAKGGSLAQLFADESSFRGNSSKRSGIIDADRNEIGILSGWGHGRLFAFHREAWPGLFKGALPDLYRLAGC
jgi:hypothetical protein